MVYVFRDHAEWLVDVLLPQGENSVLFTPTDSILTSAVWNVLKYNTLRSSFVYKLFIVNCFLQQRSLLFVKRR